jgi:hypothetical protein
LERIVDRRVATGETDCFRISSSLLVGIFTLGLNKFSSSRSLLMQVCCRCGKEGGKEDQQDGGVGVLDIVIGELWMLVFEFILSGVFASYLQWEMRGE